MWYTGTLGNNPAFMLFVNLVTALMDFPYQLYARDKLYNYADLDYNIL